MKLLPFLLLLTGCSMLPFLEQDAEIAVETFVEQEIQKDQEIRKIQNPGPTGSVKPTS